MMLGKSYINRQQRGFSLVEIIFATLLSSMLAYGMLITINQSSITMRSATSRTSADLDSRQLLQFSSKFIKSAHENIFYTDSTNAEITASGSVFEEPIFNGNNQIFSFYTYATPSCGQPNLPICVNPASGVNLLTPPNRVYFIFNPVDHTIVLKILKGDSNLKAISDGNYTTQTSNSINGATQFYSIKNVYSIDPATVFPRQLCVGNKLGPITDTGSVSGSGGNNIFTLVENSGATVPIGSISTSNPKYVKVSAYFGWCNNNTVMSNWLDIYIDLPSSEYV